MAFDFDFTEDYALTCDANDDLQHFRDLFLIPADADGREKIYFCGNSLGLQPRNTAEMIQKELSAWSKYGVRSFDQAENPWGTYSADLEKSLANLVGASAVEVAAANSLSVNLHLLLTSFYRPEGVKCKIIMEQSAFPSDLYAIKAQMRLHGVDPTEALVILKPLEGESTIRFESFEALFDENKDSIALLMLGGVNYYTGQVFEMEKIAELAHSNGAKIGLDLAHAVANVKLKLHDWNIDFAVWCSYKYLNGGPGAVGGLFVHTMHHGADLQRLAGWWGHSAETRFDMLEEFVPETGAGGWQLSNPPILQLAALKASLSVIEQAGFDRMLAKSKKLTAYLEYMITQLHCDNLEIITPANPSERGSQLSIRVLNRDRSIHTRLEQAGVIADWRQPDVIRVAPTALYNSFHEVYRFVKVLEEIMS